VPRGAGSICEVVSRCKATLVDRQDVPEMAAGICSAKNGLERKVVRRFTFIPFVMGLDCTVTYRKKGGGNPSSVLKKQGDDDFVARKAHEDNIVL
jgi:hypothetical protein